MTGFVARTCRKLTQTISRRLPERYRRDDSGLTTLEWLLIVAAVAGMAALAVVLVTNVVDDTSEQISGSSARLTAARVAGARITEEAQRDVPATAALNAAGFTAAQTDYQDECNRLEIIYSDIDGLEATWTYTAPGTFTAATWAAAFDDPDTEGCVITP